MKSIEEIAQETPIVEDLDAQYDAIIEKLQQAKTEKQPIDEGLLGSIIGGVAGVTVGPTVMKTICKVLGIDEKGPLGSLMTSRLIITAAGAKLGWRV